MITKGLQLLSGAFAVLVLAATLAWYNSSSTLQEARTRAAARFLDPVAVLLTQNQRLVEELQTDALAGKDNDILVAYLAKIRRDGLPKHTAMKQRLEQLADNHIATVTLLTAYAPDARTAGLVRATEKFRQDAAIWRSRWNATMELFMAGGNMAETSPPPTAEVFNALAAERTAEP